MSNLCPNCGTPWHEHTSACTPKSGPKISVHKCPVCDGTGLVSRPPGVAGDLDSWTSSGTGPYQCRSCGGDGVIWRSA